MLICLNCKTPEGDRPLLVLKFQGEEIYICPQCLPILIHEPRQLLSKLPGAEALQPHEH